MSKITFIFSLIFLLTSCFEVEELDFNGIDGVKIEKIEKKSLDINLGVKVMNPNGFTLKVKSSEVDVYAEDILIGKASIDHKIKIIRKKENTYTIPIHVDLEDGVLLKFIKFALKDKVKVRIKGFVKGSVLGISKKILVDETKEIEGKNFKFDSNGK